MQEQYFREYARALGRDMEFKVYGPRGACITGSYGPKAGTRIERSEGIGRQNLIVHNPRKPHGNDE